MIDVGVTSRDQGYVVRMCMVLIVLAVSGRFCFTLVCRRWHRCLAGGSGTDIRHDLYAKVNQLARQTSTVWVRPLWSSYHERRQPGTGHGGLGIR